ncbi:winged helix DNA-binding domain-containing protein [Klenkia sp. PcliD-1-E]|uniref:winged helix DNA-binding domain-containing protein n=1 Tax=Klenkia sp. PcliD-1-E TaxID=2954492 RepID=UPI00209804A9|nr:winged helix DNA-binding domain-containing protein [Klenkia sp. PcliD-1-E]MCO7221349.1 winged helix DNA-binding domain-containing protein [Klenkia sp. PcliD-1-E]
MPIDVLTLRRMRLAALGLTRPRGGVVGTVAGLLALQAQDRRQAEWAIGSRVPGSTVADVWAAFDSGAVVRAWPMRGTLFATTPADLRLLLSLTAQRQMRTAEPRHRQLGITDADVARAADVARTELAGGGALTRPELAGCWAAAGLDVSGQRTPHLYGRLAHLGVLCLGPRRGETAGGPVQAFVLLDEWAPGEPPPDRAAAVAELTEVRCGEAVLWAHGEPPPADPDGLRALAGFDELVLGHTDRSWVLAEGRFELVVPGGNGVFLPVLVEDGEVVGTWKRKRTGVAVGTFRDVPRAEEVAAATSGFRA